MVDISTKYLGLQLTNPIVVGSCGLTDSIDGVKDLEQNGAGAIVLKSVFEEEIALEFEEIMRKEAPNRRYSEHFDYLDYQIREQNLQAYSTLISECKNRVSLPVIASVNCTYSHEWAFFAKTFEDAGADAIELNMFFLPSDLTRSSEEQEQAYFDIIKRVKQELTIPVSLKISYYFSHLGYMIQKLSNTGIAGLILFNRFSNPDFDIDTFKVIPKDTFSTPNEQLIPLRWIAMMSGKVNCDLVASTGIHDGRTVIKQLLAGAQAVQVVSALYKHGNRHLQVMLETIENWMEKKGFESIEQFRGKMSQIQNADPATYERAQYIKQFGGKNSPGKIGNA